MSIVVSSLPVVLHVGVATVSVVVGFVVDVVVVVLVSVVVDLDNGVDGVDDDLVVLVVIVVAGV